MIAHFLRLITIRQTFTLLACFIACSTTQVAQADDAQLESETTVLQADDSHQWYKGNMHTHSHWSDGSDYLEMIGAWYRERDYGFLVFTDHNVLAKTERWIDVKASKGGLVAYEKYKKRFPKLLQERTVEKEVTKDKKTTTEEVLQVRLSTFEEVSKELNVPGKFLLVQGEEISDFFNDHGRKRPLHLNVSNVEEVIEPRHGSSITETIQNNVRAVMPIARVVNASMPIVNFKKLFTSNGD